MLVDAENSVLTIIDFQPKLAAAISESPSTLENCVKLITAANSLSVPCMISEQYSKGLGHTDPRITAQTSPDTILINKTCFSCTSVPQYLEQLQLLKKRQVILCGMEAHVCVLQTAIQLLEHNYTVFVAEDATCSRSPSHKTNAMARMRQAGIIIASMESILFEWMRDAKHEQFKTISALIK